MDQPFTVRQSLLFAVVIALATAALCLAMFPITHGGDFVQFHYHAHNWLAGKDPYEGGFPVMRSTRVVPEPLFYPLPTILAVAPFALLPVPVATALFVGCSSGLLAYALGLKGPEKLPMFFSAAFIVALGLGQWSPLVTATFVLPALAWLAVLKPNLGLATTAAKPTLVGVAGGGALLLGTLLVQPDWPREWLRNLHSMPAHPAPVSVPGGVLLLVALVRWRRPEARLIVAMACVPQLMYFADQLPLWLVPSTRRESVVLSALSLVAWGAALLAGTRPGHQPAFESSAFVLIGIYAPALFMVLRRPNEGDVPYWFEPFIARMPASLRGVPSSPAARVSSARANRAAGASAGAAAPEPKEQD